MEFGLETWDAWTSGQEQFGDAIIFIVHQTCVKLLALFSLVWSGYDPCEKVRQRTTNERCVAMSAIPNPQPSFGRKWSWSPKSYEQIILKEVFEFLSILERSKVDKRAIDDVNAKEKISTYGQ